MSTVAQGCITGLGIVAAGIAVRQTDRWWFSPIRGRRPSSSLREIMRLQRERANDLTPILLLAGHWLETIGWWMIAVYGGAAGAVAAVLAMAVMLRHLQEATHFAVHGVLCRDRRLGERLAEIAVHAPLGLVPVPTRKDRHVRQHHPNATVSGVDPNLNDLHRASLRPGIRLWRFAAAVVYPLTPRGVADTVRGIIAGLRPDATRAWWRVAVFAAVPVAAGLILGWQAALFGWAVPRLLLYPQLAWGSLLVEHLWFDPEPDPGAATPVEAEAARCLRLYRRNPVLALLARITWLPYGDLFHFAHSAHPSVRWNYLPALDRILGAPAYVPRGLLLGDSTVLARHRRALTVPVTPARPIPA